MKSTEQMSDETARELFGMVFDEGGVAVPPDDLAPGAMAGYRRFRRRRTALAGAGASAALVGVACLALVVAGGGVGRSGTAPGVWLSAEATMTATGPETGPSTPPQASTSAPGSSGSRIVDCLTNFVADGDLAKSQADCRHAESLWQAVFPGLAVSGARNPSFAQIANGFVARVSAQNAAVPALYGHAQPQVVQDWAAARQEDADAGPQTWSGFNIATAQGTVMVSADYRSGANSTTHLRCLGASPCESVPLSDGSVAEVSSIGPAHSYAVTVRAPDGDAYRISLTSHFEQRYVDVPCTAPIGNCYADLADGSIHHAASPDDGAVIFTPLISQAMVTDILTRPAFAALVQGYFAGKLGQPGS